MSMYKAIEKQQERQRKFLRRTIFTLATTTILFGSLYKCERNERIHQQQLKEAYEYDLEKIYEQKRRQQDSTYSLK